MILLSPMLFAQSQKVLIRLKSATTGANIPGESILIFKDPGNSNVPTGNTASQFYTEIYDVTYNFSNDYLTGLDRRLENTNAYPISGVISFRKNKGKLSKTFFEYNSTGTHFKEIEINYVKFNGEGYINYMTYKFKLGFVKAVNEAEDLIEQIDLVVLGVWIQYEIFLPNGQMGTPVSYGWDITTKATWDGTVN